MSNAVREARWAASDAGFPFEPFLLDADAAARAADLFRRRGVVVLGPPALDSAAFDALAAESTRQRRVANWTLAAEPTGTSLGQDTIRAHLGPLARNLMAAGATRALMQQVTGDVVIPGWSATCLTYYDTPGQYLGAHRDKDDECHHAMLIYLHARWPAGAPPGPGVKLHVLEPDESTERLVVTAFANRIVILHGSRLTHYRPPLAVGEEVGLLAGCFRVVG